MLKFAQQLLRHLYMLWHADLAVHRDGFGEHLAGPVLFSRVVSY